MTRQKFQAYVICTTPRSGSTLLCRMLAATGLAGVPDSHFHTPSLRSWLGYYGLSPDDHPDRRAALATVFAAARRRGSGDTGLFGLRLQRDSFAYFMGQLALLHPDPQTDAGRIRAAFGPTLFVHLSRADTLDQAISYVKADQTGLWHRAADGSELERLAPPAAPRYDAGEIGRQKARLSALDADWRTWFTEQGLTPLALTYEDLADDPTGTLSKILGALGRDPGAARNVAPETLRLADQVNRDWARRYLAETRGAGD